MEYVGNRETTTYRNRNHSRKKVKQGNSLFGPVRRRLLNLTLLINTSYLISLITNTFSFPTFSKPHKPTRTCTCSKLIMAAWTWKTWVKELNDTENAAGYQSPKSNLFLRNNTWRLKPEKPRTARYVIAEKSHAKGPTPPLLKVSRQPAEAVLFS